MLTEYDYTEATRLLSLPRLASYKTSIASKDDAELFGAYSWNLAVIGAFYPLLQLIEVALRNAINLAAIDKVECTGGKFWIECIKFKDAHKGEKNSTATQAEKFKNNIRKATKSARKSLSDKGVINPTPTLDQIISQCDFSTWEYLLDKHFYNGADNSFFWPNGLFKVFKKLPKTDHNNPIFHQRDIIRRRIEEVRSFRNRISHNEPAWRIGDLKNSTDVIDVLTRKLENMMELLFWISPKFRKYVKDVGIESRILQLLNQTELDRYMHIFEQHDITEVSKLEQLTIQANINNTRCYFNVNGNKGIIHPRNSSLPS